MTYDPQKRRSKKSPEDDPEDKFVWLDSLKTMHPTPGMVLDTLTRRASYSKVEHQYIARAGVAEIMRLSRLKRTAVKSALRYLKLTGMIAVFRERYTIGKDGQFSKERDWNDYVIAVGKYRVHPHVMNAKHYSAWVKQPSIGLDPLPDPELPETVGGSAPDPQVVEEALSEASVHTEPGGSGDDPPEPSKGRVPTHPGSAPDPLIKQVQAASSSMETASPEVDEVGTESESSSADADAREAWVWLAEDDGIGARLEDDAYGTVLGEAIDALCEPPVNLSLADVVPEINALVPDPNLLTLHSFEVLLKAYVTSRIPPEPVAFDYTEEF